MARKKPWDEDPWPDLARKFLTTPEKAYCFLRRIKFVPQSERPKASSGMKDTFHDLLRDTGIPFSQINELPLDFLHAYGQWKYGADDNTAFRNRMAKVLKALGS